MKRKCGKCHQIKDESDFRYINKYKRLQSYCKQCEKEYLKEYCRARYQRKKEQAGQTIQIPKFEYSGVYFGAVKGEVE